MREILIWGLGRREAQLFFSELEELFKLKSECHGTAVASRWRRRELRRACFNATLARLEKVFSSRRKGERLPDKGGVKGIPAGLMRDVSFGLRTLRRRPGFAGMVVGLLGLGIGTFTVMFSLVEGILLRDLPYEGKGELVKVWQTYPHWKGLEGRDGFWDKVGLNWEEFLTLRRETRTLASIAVFRSRTMTLTGSGMPERLDVGEASPGLFPLLGVRPVLGRAFLPGEEGPGAAPLAVLGHNLWASRFGSDPNIVGRTVELDGAPFEVIGVMPQGFRVRSTFYNLLNQSRDTGARALWVPVHHQGLGLGAHELEGIGRLAPGQGVAQLQSELLTLLGEGRSPEELGFRVTRPRDEVTDGYRSSLVLLLTASAFLLLIACSSIAVLFLSEAMGREREMATRMALGAGRGRIARQLLTESLLMGVLGALLGLTIAWAGTRVIGALAPPLPRMEEVGMNIRVLLGAILTGCGTGILFGLAPVSLRWGVSLRSGQGVGDRGSTGAGGTLQRWVISAELAFTAILLVNGGLLTRSLIKLAQVDPGFDAAGVATVHVPVPASGDWDSERLWGLYRELLESVRALPGVEEAGAVDGLPFPGIPTGDEFEIVRAQGDAPEFITPRDHLFLPGYLETMGIPVLAGRPLSDADLNPEGVRAALINQAMARLYWPDRSPLGARIRQGPMTLEIVGIVGDMPEASLSAAPLPTVFRCGPQFPQGGMSLVARAKSDPSELVSQMREVIWAVDPELPLSQGATLPALVSASTVSERYRTTLVMFFAVLAALIAATGVFGVTAHSVSRRTREMGVRMALGATDGSLVRGIVGESLVPSAAGLGVGFLGALATSRLMENFVFGIGTWDGLTFLAVGTGLSCLSLLATVLPAHRAARIEPMRVLREE